MLPFKNFRQTPSTKIPPDPRLTTFMGDERHLVDEMGICYVGCHQGPTLDSEGMGCFDVHPKSKGGKSSLEKFFVGVVSGMIVDLF